MTEETKTKKEDSLTLEQAQLKLQRLTTAIGPDRAKLMRGLDAELNSPVDYSDALAKQRRRIDRCGSMQQEITYLTKYVERKQEERVGR